MIDWIFSVWAQALFFSLAISLAAYFLFKPKGNVPKSDNVRPFGSFEYVFHGIVNTCSHFNISVAFRFRKTFDTSFLALALQELQARHTLLRSQVVKYSGVAVIGEMENCPPIPFRILHRSLPEEWKQILEAEVNTPFEASLPLVRCTVLQPVESNSNGRYWSDEDEIDLNKDEVGSEMVLTVRHDIMDGKSTALLVAELLEIYTQICDELKRSSDGEKSPRVAKNIRNRIRKPSTPISPPVDVLFPKKLPRWTLFIVHLFHFIRLHSWFLRIPSRLLHTNRPTDEHLEFIESQRRKDGSRKRPLWNTGIVYREISAEETSKIVAKCKAHNTTIGSLLFVALMNASARTIVANEPDLKKVTIWGVFLVDLRPMAIFEYLKKKKKLDSIANQSQKNSDNSKIEPVDPLYHMPFDPESLGVFISTLDFVQQWNFKSESLDDVQAAWRKSADFRTEYQSSMRSGKHLSSIVFASYLANVSNMFSRKFSSPGLAPCFSLSNIGNLDKAPPNIPGIEDSRFARLTRQKDRYPYVKDCMVGITSSTSYPVPLVTCMTFNGKLRMSFSYGKETSTHESVEAMADRCLAYLHLIAQSED